LRRALELKFEGESHPKTRSARYRNTVSREERAGKERKAKGCGKQEEIGDVLHIDSYRTGMMLEEQAEED
jgi:hypothetical protein